MGRSLVILARAVYQDSGPYFLRQGHLFLQPKGDCGVDGARAMGADIQGSSSPGELMFWGRGSSLWLESWSEDLPASPFTIQDPASQAKDFSPLALGGLQGHTYQEPPGPGGY